MSYKPPGHNALSPYLIVDDAEAAIAFIKAVFGADPSFIARGPDGAPQHVEVTIDDTVLMIGQSPGGPDSNIHVYVDDLEGAFERAKAAGGTVIQTIQDKGDGDLRCGIQDPTGTNWWLARFVSLEGR